MRCEKIKKWLSDNIDNKISNKKKELIEDHLKKCSPCRSYASSLDRIQEETKNLEVPELTPAFWVEFASRLRRKITLSQPEKREGVPFFTRKKWIWTSVVSVFLIVVGLFLYLGQDKAPLEVYVFSFEESVSQICQEIGSDFELEELFNLIITASIGDILEETETDINPDFYGSSQFWEYLTEKEIKFLESEIKERNKT